VLKPINHEIASDKR